VGAQKTLKKWTTPWVRRNFKKVDNTVGAQDNPKRSRPKQQGRGRATPWAMNTIAVTRISKGKSRP